MKLLMLSTKMEHNNLTPDSTFPYRLFRFAHKRALDSVSASYFAVVSKDNNPVGLVLSVDIDERWHHARQAATNLWQIFVREFTHSESRSTLNRFEESLKELNKAVVKTQEKVKQTISVTVIVLEGNQINFSTIGTSRILLHRSGKVNDVTTGSTINGNQFAAVTSGDVDTNDTILIANQNLYEFITTEPDELWEGSDVTELSKKILSRTQNSKQSLNCVILRYSPDNTAQTTLYWEESEKHYPIKWPKFSLPAIPKFSLSTFSLPKIKISKEILDKFMIIFSKIKSAKLPNPKAGSKSVIKRIKPIYIYILAIIVAVGFGVSAVLKKQNNSANNPDEVASVVERFSNTSAQEQLEFMLELSSSGKVNNLSPEETNQIIAAAAVNNIVLVSLTGKISELPENIVSISSLDGVIYLLDETGQLWQVGINDQLKQLDHLIKINNPVSLVAFSETSLVASDSLGNIWHYNGETTGPTSLVLPSNLSAGKKLIAKYLTNLYIYSEDKNAIYRQVNFTDSIAANSPYSGLTSLGSSKIWSWSINGDFIFLTNQSSVIGLLRDKITLDAVSVPNSTIESKISSSEKVIAVKDRQLLSLYSPDGLLLWQKFYLTDKEIGDISISGDTLWYSIGKEIYRVAI